MAHDPDTFRASLIRESAPEVYDFRRPLVVAPSALCAVCGHVRNDHETIEREWCAACAVGSRQDSAHHLFSEAGKDA